MKLLVVCALVFLAQQNHAQISVGMDLGGGAGGIMDGAGRAAGNMQNGARGILDGAGNIIGNIEDRASSLIGNIEGDAQKIIGDIERKAGAAIGDVTKDAGKLIDDLQRNEKRRKHSKTGDRKRPNGRGIDRRTGVGSFDGLLTPMANLFGVAQAFCGVENGAEDFIGKIGETRMAIERQIIKIDQAVANYLVEKVVKNVIDAIRRGQINLVEFLINTHGRFDLFIINTIVEVYRITKAPVRELMACNRN